MNILLTSVGRRSYLVKYFKEVLGDEGKVHVSNSSPITPAFECADKSVVTPLIYDGNYISFLHKYCIENSIDAIISLFDIDLPILSANKKRFEEIGTKVIVSDEEVIRICNDKWETYNFLINNGLNAPKTYINFEKVVEALRNNKINYPVIIKPRWGMGSISVYEAENEDELRIFYNKSKKNIMDTYLRYESKDKIETSVLIQEKLKGQEYGLDIINDLNGKYKNTVVKKKFAMRSGETDCAEIMDNPMLKSLGEDVSKKLNHIANLDMDVFLIGEVPYILEMNARFGGGYPFSHMAGVNLPKAIIDWLRDANVESSILEEKIGIIAHKDIEIIQIKSKKEEETPNFNNYEIKQINTYEDIKNVINKFDKLFEPALSERSFKIEDLVKKIKDNALVYVAKDKEVLGFVAFYANDNNIAYLTLIAVSAEYQKMKIGKTLLDLCTKVAKDKGMNELKLEVHNSNIVAKKFYSKNGFIFAGEASEDSIYMKKSL